MGYATPEVEQQPRNGLVAGVFLALLIACAGENANAQSSATDVPAACAGFPADPGLRFGFAGFCTKLSGTLLAIFQDDLSTTGSGAPSRLTSNGTPSFQRYTKTYEATATLATKRQTPLGEFDTGITAQWLKASDDGTHAGNASVQELKAELAGGTVGYTSSLMNFWSEDFQFLAAAPSRTAGIVSYEHRVFDDTKLALAVESGLPTSKQNTEGLSSVDFSSPILTARLLYANADKWQFQLAGLLRQAKEQANPIIASRPSTTTTSTGWAPTAGATVPTRFIDPQDYVSTQATYAFDASQFLGTKADLSSLSSIVPSTGPTSGWSAVASFHHQWSKQWETNLFASYLSLDINLANANPSVRTKRYDINLYWTPVDTLRFGVELGRVETQINANGALGYLTGVSGKAYIGFLDAKWSF